VKNAEEIALVPVIVERNVPNGIGKLTLFGRESASLEMFNEKNEHQGGDSESCFLI
jgi:hypothetical protein